MILSSYSNWETDFHSQPFIHQVEADADQLLAADHHPLEYCWDPFDDHQFPFIDPYIELNNSFLLHPDDQNYTPFIDPFIPLPLYENFSSYSCPDPYSIPTSFFDGHRVALNSCPVLEDHHHHREIQSRNIGIHSEGTETSVRNLKKKADEKCVSAQSIAARERRRKITKKTQELGKLVPGGSKMNTAEMLQVAFNYVKYLQAQLGILQLMSSFQEEDKEEGNCCCKEKEEKMKIVASPKVQEKLYEENKCLVPKDFVQCLTTISRPPLSDELNRLLS